MQYLHIKRFNKLWYEGLINKPIIILIGGYCGTGKSTLAAHISAHIKYITVLPTGIFRSLLKIFIPQETNPALYVHTFDLYNLSTPEKKTNEEIIKNFIMQSKPVYESIHRIIEFVRTERQHYIIEGNHIIPDHLFDSKDIILIEIYTKVSDRKTHYNMMSGPTHYRHISDRQFKTGRLIQEYIVETAKKNHKRIFEFNSTKEEVLEIINTQLGKELKKLNLE